MSTPPVNLVDLKQLLAGMTPRPWVLHGRNYSDEIDGDVDNLDGPVTVARMGCETTNSDRPGIVALVNAAPVLIEIVDAVLAVAERTAFDRTDAQQVRLLAALALVTGDNQ
jgi:hypothetical protein